MSGAVTLPIHRQEDFAVLNRHRKSLDRLEGRHNQRRAGADIETRAVARALDLIGVDDLAIAQTGDVEATLQRLLVGEYQRRLARYRLTDRLLSEKYKVGFAEFEDRQMTKALGYSWEVESDAIAWETAVDGIITVQGQLASMGIGEPPCGH